MNWFDRCRHAIASIKTTRTGTLSKALGRGTTLALAALVLVPAGALAQDAPIDRELGKYWNVEQAVPSLEHPLFERKGAFEASAHLGVMPNDNFYLPLPVGARVGYHALDSLAIEGSFSYLMTSESDLLAFLKCPTGGSKCTSLTTGGQEPPKLNWTASLNAVYSPFHGKLGIFASKISSFDINFSAGLGIINADIDESAIDAKGAESAIKVGGNWGAGFRFFLTDALNLRVDYRQFIYKPQESISFLAPVEFSLGVAYLVK